MDWKLYNKIVFSTILLTVLGAGTWFFLLSPSHEVNSGPTPPGWGDVSFTGLDANVASLGTSTSLADSWQKYESSAYGFSFLYPQGFTVGSFREGGGEMIVIQSVDNHQGFQVYITPVDEEITMTPERIRSDIEEIRISDPQPIEIGEDSRGLAFISNSPAFGESREAWFTYGSYLYQASTYRSLEGLLQQVMNTWEFE